MENLAFAFNAIAPTFSIVLLGIFMRKGGFLTEDLIKKGNKLCFQLFLPVLVFFNIYEAGQVDAGYIKVIAFAVANIFICLGLFLLIVPKVLKDKRQVSVMIQSMYRGNFMLYGLSFSQSLGGEVCVAMATSMMAVTLPLLNVIGIFVYSFFSDEGEKPDMKKAAINALKMPILWGIILGLICHAISMPMPQFLYDAGKDVAGIATPLSFLFLGGQFQMRSSRKHAKLLTVGVAVKLLLMPLPFIWAAVSLFHFHGDQLIPLFIFLSAPSAITNYQLATQFNADYELAGEFLVYSMAFSALSMFVMVWGLRTLALI